MFDSGSSCSNEECWEVNHDHTGKNYGSKGKILPLTSSMTTSLSSQSKVLTSSQSIEKVKLINGELKQKVTKYLQGVPKKCSLARRANSSLMNIFLGTPGT